MKLPPTAWVLPTLVLTGVTLVMFGPASTVVSASSDGALAATGPLPAAVQVPVVCRARDPPIEADRDRRGESQGIARALSELTVRAFCSADGLFAQLSPATTTHRAIPNRAQTRT
jgi:hypothetical protein